VKAEELRVVVDKQKDIPGRLVSSLQMSQDEVLSFFISRLHALERQNAWLKTANILMIPFYSLVSGPSQFTNFLTGKPYILSRHRPG
jgi:hypothetical protein